MIGKVRGSHYRIQSQVVCEGGGDERQDQKLSENQSTQQMLEYLSPFGYRAHLKTAEAGIILIAFSWHRVDWCKPFSSHGNR